MDLVREKKVGKGELRKLKGCKVVGREIILLRNG